MQIKCKGVLNIHEQPRNPIISFFILITCLEQRVTYAENDDMEGKGKTGRPLFLSLSVLLMHQGADGQERGENVGILVSGKNS